MVAGEVASMAKTYRGISKCVLNMYIDAYIYIYIYIIYIYIYPKFLWNPHHPNHPILSFNASGIHWALGPGPIGPIHALGPVGPGPCLAHSRGFICWALGPVGAIHLLGPGLVRPGPC